MRVTESVDEGQTQAWCRPRGPPASRPPQGLLLLLFLCASPCLTAALAARPQCTTLPLTARETPGCPPLPPPLPRPLGCSPRFAPRGLASAALVAPERSP